MGVAKMEDRECGCGNVWAVMMFHSGEVLNNDRTDDPLNLTCPKCDSPDYTKLFALAKGIWQGGDHGVGRHYPHFNRGLGCEVRSRKHYFEICKARNLHPVEGDVDIETAAIQRGYREEEAIKKWKDLQDYYKNGPDQELRKAWGEMTKPGYNRPPQR